ncbi:MAG: glucose-6-phosphate isomerase family protein [archaeon]
MLIKEIRKKGEVHITKVKDMQNFFKDISGYPLNKEIYRVLVIEREHLSYAITIIKLGDVNKEFNMTKGHYHSISASEVYYPIKGKGIIILQKGNDFKKIEMKKGRFYEIPEGYAHRTINTGDKDLEVLNIYTSNSGHDYKKIEKEGFKKRFY